MNISTRRTNFYIFRLFTFFLDYDKIINIENRYKPKE